MFTIRVCVGSSCFVRGSKKVVMEIKQLISEYNLEHKVALKGSFCLERCTDGVTITIGEKIYTGVHSEDIRKLFEKEVLPVVKAVD